MSVRVHCLADRSSYAPDAVRITVYRQIHTYIHTYTHKHCQQCFLVPVPVSVLVLVPAFRGALPPFSILFTVSLFSQRRAEPTFQPKSNKAHQWLVRSHRKSFIQYNTLAILGQLITDCCHYIALPT